MVRKSAFRFTNCFSGKGNKIMNNDKTLSNLKECFTYEEALDETSNGPYNWVLLGVMIVMYISMGLDLFGFSVVITGCGCEFQLTLAQRSILSSLPFAGCIVMSYPWGYISDTQGRRRSLLIAVGVSCTAALLSSLSPNWIVLGVLRFISSGCSSCIQSTSYVLLGESCCQRVRGTYMLFMTAFFVTSLGCSYVLGYLILNLDFLYELGFLGHFSPWRLLVLVNGMALGLVGLLLLMFLYESPKFLANEGREAEALSVLKMIWIRNGKDPQKFRIKSILVEDQGISQRRNIPLLQSLWQQTAPLFKPPYVLRSLQLFYLNAVIVGVANAFIVWFPLIADAFFLSLKSPERKSEGLCELMVSGYNEQLRRLNASNNLDSCSSRLEDNTVISGSVYTSLFFFIFLLLSQVSSWKKTVLIVLLMIGTISTAAVTLTPEPVTAISFYVSITVVMIGAGFISSFFVELYPTSYRGMISSLGSMVSRLMALISINIVGAFAISHCQVTFYGYSLFCLSGVIVACFLPSSKSVTKKLDVRNIEEEN